MKSLLLVERFILENVSAEGETIDEISQKTNLSTSIIQSALYYLKSMNIVLYKNGYYFINESEKLKWQAELNKEKNKRYEIMDLFSQLLNFYYKSERKGVDLKLERANMDEFEYKIFQSHLNRLSEFFQGIRQKKNGSKTRSRKNKDYIFLYAKSSFPSLVQASIS